MTTILIARHGNTFDPGDLVVRVGRKSDLPLSKSGEAQAQLLGTYLKQNNIILSAVYTSSLLRTINTAKIILQALGTNLPIQQDANFNEIDYGPDEGKTDLQVIGRIGEAALAAWDQNAVVPKDWVCDPTQIINYWRNFARQAANKYPQQTILVVTSNGIARFAPYITGDFAQFNAKYKIKMATGAISSFTNEGEDWLIDYWDKRL